LGLGGFALWLFNAKFIYGRIRKAASREERIRIAAEWNKVPVDEVRAELERREDKKGRGGMQTRRGRHPSLLRRLLPWYHPVSPVHAATGQKAAAPPSMR